MSMICLFVIGFMMSGIFCSQIPAEGRINHSHFNRIAALFHVGVFLIIPRVLRRTICQICSAPGVPPFCSTR